MESDACSSPTEVFVSETKSKNLLYQIHVPVGSDFEAKLNPGEYTIRAANKDGCLSEQKISLGKKQVELNLTLSNKPSEDRSPASSGLCLYCNYNYSPMQMSPYFVGPWWNNFGNWSYPNFSYPCTWGGWGCGGTSYPPGGPIVMGKPNIYLRGADTKNVSIRLGEKSLAKLIATSPAHMEKGWNVSLKKNQIYNGKVKIPYLFYDARAEVKNLQNKFGFCGAAPAVLDSMMTDLKQAKFPKEALADFEEHWRYKLPPMGRFCVFPQHSKTLQDEVPFDVVGTEVHWNRVLYFIVPYPAGRQRPPKFLEKFVQGPDELWTRRGNDRTPSGSKTITAYEWGVAFPFVD